jgi:hypothetical protein
MPNVKRVRQDQEAAAKRYGEYANLVENYNAQVGQVNSANQAAADLYNQQAAEYNRFVDSVKAGGYGLAPVDGGGYASVHGDVEKGIIEYTNRDELGQPIDKGGMYGSAAELPQNTPLGGSAGIAYVRNPDGTATPYQNMLTDIDAGTYAWQAIGAPIRVMEFTAKPPTQQELNVAQPAEPKPWNPSRRDIAELQNPTVDAAGGQLAAAVGSYANTGILAEANNRSPILANPEDEPLTPSSSGILARVRAGEF